MKILRAEIRGTIIKIKAIRKLCQNENPIKMDMINIASDAQVIIDELNDILHDNQVRRENRLSEDLDTIQHEYEIVEQELVIKR